MQEEPEKARLERIRDTLRQIEKMLNEQKRDDYFEALRQKAANRSSVNVTAAFFSGGL